MKEKLIKSISIVAAIGIILGLGLSINKSLATQADRLEDGQPDPDSFNYNINTPNGYEIKDDPGEARFHLADIPGFQVYCIQPNSPLRYAWDKEWDDIESHPPHNQYKSGHWLSCFPTCEYHMKFSPIRIFHAGQGNLSDAAAYIVSHDPATEWSQTKQLALWYLRDRPDATANDGCTLDLDGGLIIGGGSITHAATAESEQLDDEAEAYAIYQHDLDHHTEIDPLTGTIKENIAPVDATEGRGIIQYLNSTDEYIAKDFAVDYINGEYNGVTFAGITDMYLIGYNRFGEPVKDASGQPKRIDFDRLNILDSTGTTLDRTIKQSELEFFEPEEENMEHGQKIDRTTQNYPKPGELFEVVYKNPNDGIDQNDEENRVVTVTLKVKFKYMRAKGEYMKLELKKIYCVFHHTDTFHGHRVCGRYSCWTVTCQTSCKAWCTLEETQQQYHMAADAIRAIYEDEIDLRPGGHGTEEIIPDMSMQIGGRVWLDMQVSKEGAGWDGEYTGPNTGNTLRAETLVNPDNEGDFANDVDRLVKGVEVQLFEQVNGVLNPEPISITVTDEDGKYIFYGLDLAKKYTLKFVYNGLMFQTTTYNPDLKGNHSNITEQQADRDVFNQNFAEIAAYPNNYPVRVELFKAPGEYNQSWSIEDLTQKDDSLYYQWVDKAYEIVKQQRDQDKFKPVNDGSKPVSPFILAAQQLATDDETRSQLQFLMDARIDAWTGDNSNLNNPGGLKYYPEIPAGFDGPTPMAREEADDPNTGAFYTAEGYKTIAIYDGVDFDDSEVIELKVPTVNAQGQPHTITYQTIRRTYIDNRDKDCIIDSVLRIDGGLTWRPQFDVSLKKDVYKATLKINGKTQVYTYNSRNISAGDGDLTGNQSPSVNGRTYKDTTWDIEVRKKEGYYRNPQEYQRDLFKTDYDYRRTDYNNNTNRDPSGGGVNADDIIQAIKDGTELEVYVTYKIGIRNQSQSIRGAITEIVDYYDSTYTYEPNLSFATWSDDQSEVVDSGEIGDGVAEIFAQNKIDKKEFEEGMKQEFKIDNNQTYYAENRRVLQGKTLRDYVSSAREISGNQDSIYRDRAGSQKTIGSYQSIYVTGLEDKQLDAGESLYVYLTFRVIRQAQGDGLDVTDAKENTAEINGYKTFYKEGTTLANYAGTNDYTTPADMPAGLIDKDSTPGNITSENEIANPEEYFEDDTDKAPNFRLVVKDEDKRQLNGVVWEDKRNENSSDAVVGNGKKDNGEDNIEGVTVQFIEVIQKEKDSVDYVESIWKEVKTTTDGYEFIEFIPGNYYVKFIYGDGKETVIASEDLYGNAGQNPVTNLVGGGNSNKRSYNGHDYKSTTYQTGVNQGDGYYTVPTPFIRGQQVNGYTNYGNSNGTYGGAQNEVATYIYDIGTMDQNPGVSDAKDIGSLRDSVVNYSKDNVRNHVAEVLASPYKVPEYNGQSYTATEQEALLNELMRETQMSAISGVMDIELEYNRTQSVGDDEYQSDIGTNGEYIHAGLDLGLEERPEAQLTVNKTVYQIDIKDSTGKSLFNSQNLSPVANLVWLRNAGNRVDKENSDKLLKHDYLGTLGLLQPTVDEESMRGMVVTITYQITIKNDSEVDYIESEFYYTGENGREKSRTQVNNMIDYVDLNLRYVQTGNDAWKMVDGSQNANDYTTALISGNNGLLNEKLREFIDNDFEQIIQLSNARGANVPGDVDTITLVLSQTITAEDLESTMDTNGNILETGKLNFNNLTELVETSNTLGRRMEFSVVGNQQPNIDPTEIDAAKAEEVIVMGPFGTRAPTLYAVLGISICAILITGVVIIKKKVLK